ncbi:MAG: hypothetical protein ACYC8T_11635 [Myxococcaceae bacterium]
MRARGASSLVRTGAVLLTVAVVGAVGGYVWERSTAPDDAPAFAARPDADDGEAPTRQMKRTEQDTHIIRRATLGLPPYKDAVPEAIGADYLGGKAPIAVAWFMTRDPPEQVIGFYAKAFKDKGLPILSHQYSANAGYVGYMDPKTEEVHLISVIAQGGETAVFPSSGQMSHFAAGDSKVPDLLPHPADAVGTTVLQFRSEGSTQLSVSASVPDRSLDQVAEFYEKGFEAKGWRVERVARSRPNEIRVEVRKGGAIATAFIRQAFLSKVVRVYLSVTLRA